MVVSIQGIFLRVANGRRSWIQRSRNDYWFLHTIAFLKIVCCHEFRAHPSKIIGMEFDNTLLDRLDVVMFWVLVRRFEYPFVQARIVNCTMCTSRLPNISCSSVDRLAFLASIFVNTPYFTLILEPCACKMIPGLASVTTDPGRCVILGFNRQGVSREIARCTN